LCPAGSRRSDRWPHPLLLAQSEWLDDRPQETSEAARLAGKAAELGNDDAVALSFGGLALGYVAGEVDAGIALTDRALALNPNLAAAWTVSGWLRASFGDPDLAIQHLTHAIRLNPLDPLMFLMEAFLAFTHFHAGRYDEAWPMAEKACRERPNFLGAQRMAAVCNAAAGRLDEARLCVARALQLDPDLRISNLKDRMGPRRAEDFAKYVEAMRKAGLPE
jgi:tetratricopeptide (TPR) repeat protein